MYSCACVSKNPFFNASSSPSPTASCAGELQEKTIRVLAARVGWIRCAGPMTHPILQPVAANDLPCDVGIDKSSSERQKREITHSRSDSDCSFPEIVDTCHSDVRFAIECQTVVLLR